MSRPQFPIVLPDDLKERTTALYLRGLPRGDLPGWRGLDDLYSVTSSQLTVITGIPGSGKSEFLDALATNLAETAGWSFAVYSPENYPTEIHMAKLTEKHLRKPFGAGPTERMTLAEMNAAVDWVNDRFRWLQPSYPNYGRLLEAALFFREPGQKKFGIILDPWNSLEHLRPSGMTETEYVCAALTDMINLSRKEDFHLFLVAHPTKMTRDPKTGVRPIPTPYDISGGAHWFSKPDNILTVHRDQVNRTQAVEIHVQKIRFKHLGHIDVARLLYDRVTGRYFDAPPDRTTDAIGNF